MEDFWRTLFTEQRASQLLVIQFGEQHHIPVTTFDNRRAQLEQHTSSAFSEETVIKTEFTQLLKAPPKPNCSAYLTRSMRLLEECSASSIAAQCFFTSLLTGLKSYLNCIYEWFAITSSTFTNTLFMKNTWNKHFYRYLSQIHSRLFRCYSCWRFHSIRLHGRGI